MDSLPIRILVRAVAGCLPPIDRYEAKVRLLGVRICRFSAVWLVRFFLFSVLGGGRFGSCNGEKLLLLAWRSTFTIVEIQRGGIAARKQKEKVMLYPIGIQNFESLRKGGFTYVDKTGLIYQLAATGRYYFLGRPRRFGKSLLLSAMEAYFQGKKELFKGLAIENQEKDWTEYPVLHLDWGGATYTSESIFNDKIENALRRWEQEYGIDNVLTADSVRFENIIDAAYGKTGKPVVILIDEYDKPIVDNLDREELKEAFRSRLSGFYSVMKAKDGKIRLGFLTGITKIGQLNIFSGLNNLKDISIDPRYVDLCGISEQDLHRYFDEGVQELGDANNLSKEACYAKLARFYDGYHFSMKSVGIYNPFSLLSTLDAKIFTEYWYATGTPTFLTVALKQTGKDISELIDNEVEVDITDLSQVDSYRVNPIQRGGGGHHRLVPSGFVPGQSHTASIPDRLSDHQGCESRLRHLPSGLSQPGGQERLPQDAVGALCARSGIHREQCLGTPLVPSHRGGQAGGDDEAAGRAVCRSELSNPGQGGEERVCDVHHLQSFGPACAYGMPDEQRAYRPVHREQGLYLYHRVENRYQRGRGLATD